MEAGRGRRLAWKNKCKTGNSNQNGACMIRKECGLNIGGRTDKNYIFD